MSKCFGIEYFKNIHLFIRQLFAECLAKGCRNDKTISALKFDIGNSVGEQGIQ